jgi:hypothetical protein
MFGLIAGWVIGSQQSGVRTPAATAQASAPPPADSGATTRAALLDDAQVNALKSVATREPKNANPRVRLGNLYFDAERYDDAIAWYTEALKLTPDEGRDIVRITELIKAAAREQLPVSHPEEPRFSGITIAQLSGPPSRADAHMKNVVTVSTGTLDWSRPSTWTGVIDRSPCGTGTCARMATLHARGRLGLHEDFRHEGLLGTVFTGRLVAETTVGRYPAVVPMLSGRAWITGFASYVVDVDDPFPEGFTVSDIW